MADNIKNKPVQPMAQEEYLWSDKKRPFFGLPLSFTRYILYPDRIIIRHGLLLRQQEEIRLYRIVDQVVRQGILQRIFGVGSIVVLSSDASTRKYMLSFIRQPYEVAQLLSDCAESERTRVGVGFYESIYAQTS